MRLFRGGRRRGGPVDFLVVGLGNPGQRYAGTRHNVGFEVADLLRERWELSRPEKVFSALLSEGRAGVDGPRVGLLTPQTFMNDSGRSVGPARGQYKLPLERVIVVYDEIDLPFGEVRPRTGGGLAGHNGLKSVNQALGGPGFQRVRVGVGRPPSSDPETVSDYVLSRFSEQPAEVRNLIDRAADCTEEMLRDV